MRSATVSYLSHSNGSVKPLFNPVLQPDLARRLNGAQRPSSSASPASATLAQLRTRPQRAKWSRDRAKRVRQIVEKTGCSSTYAYAVVALAESGYAELIADVVFSGRAVATAAAALRGYDRATAARVRAFRALPPSRQQLLLALNNC
jgi:hypothetical protein